MKHFLILLVLSITSGCGTYDKIEERDSLIVLSDSQFMVEGEDENYATDLSGAVSYLGPDTNMVISVSFCPGIKLQTRNKVFVALNEAGFTEVFPVTDPKLLNVRCALTTQSR